VGSLSPKAVVAPLEFANTSSQRFLAFALTFLRSIARVNSLACISSPNRSHLSMSLNSASRRSPRNSEMTKNSGALPAARIRKAKSKKTAILLGLRKGTTHSNGTQLM